MLRLQPVGDFSIFLGSCGYPVCGGYALKIYKSKFPIKSKKSVKTPTSKLWKDQKKARGRVSGCTFHVIKLICVKLGFVSLSFCFQHKSSFLQSGDYLDLPTFLIVRKTLGSTTLANGFFHQFIFGCQLNKKQKNWFKSNQMNCEATDARCSRCSHSWTRPAAPISLCKSDYSSAETHARWRLLAWETHHKASLAQITFENSSASRTNGKRRLKARKEAKRWLLILLPSHVVKWCACSPFNLNLFLIEIIPTLNHAI